MANVKIGDRIGAYLAISQSDKIALLLGYGTYVGNEVPPNEGYQSATAFLTGLRQPNPKLVMDDGSIIWGCECWWGPEDSVKAEVATMAQVHNVTIADARAGNIPCIPGVTHPKEPQTDFFGSSPPPKSNFWS